MSKLYKGYDDYYDDYTPTYTPKKRSSGGWKSKYGSGGWSKSSWSNFSFIVEYADNDESLYVKDPVNYVTPTASEIKKKVNIKKQTAIDTIKELARVCYFKMIEEKDYIAEQFIDSEESSYKQKKQLYDGIFEQYIPGFSPLEQALAIFLKMKDKKYDENGELIEDDDDIDMSTSLDFDRQIYTDPNINEQLELNELSKDRKMEIMNHLSLVCQFGGEFKVEKEISFIENKPCSFFYQEVKNSLFCHFL